MAASNSRIDRAGSRTRHRLRSGRPPLEEDVEIIEGFRARYTPTLEILERMLTRLRSGYAARLPTELRDQDIGYMSIALRPKTTAAILAKLLRSTTRLSGVQDIAGGRIVVGSPEIQEAVAAALHDGFSSSGAAVIDVKDTREDGDRLGYRAVHLVVELQLPAEIQVRTIRQDRWAQTVEDLDRVMGTDLKHGAGPAEWLDWLKELSFQLRRADLGLDATIPPPPTQTQTQTP